MNWVIKCCWLQVCGQCISFFVLLLIVVAKHRHNYTWLVCFAGQIKLKLKTKVHNRQFFLFTSFNQIWYFSENAIRSIAASKWIKEQTLPTAQQYIKSKCNSLSFFCVWLIRDGALLWFYSVFFSKHHSLKDVSFNCLEPLKKNWRKTNASNALNLFLSLCIFLQSNGSTHTLRIFRHGQWEIYFTCADIVFFLSH